MNEMERESQLSAMFDGELQASECELLSRRLARDEQLRGRWSRYALIGAAMRSEPVAAVSRDFAWRVSAAIDTDTGTQSARPAARNRAWRSMAAGGVLAAGVAGVAVFMLRNNLQLQDQSLVAFTPSLQHVEVAEAVAETVIAPAAAGNDEPASYVVPQQVSGGNELALPAALANYVVAHSEYSSPLVRRNLISALVGSDAAESLPPVNEPRAAPSADAGR